MPSPNPTTRREYKGAAAGTTLQNSMNSTDTTFVLVAANNWPTGGVGKFVVTVNRGQADEEKILCDSQSSRNVSCLLANRGFDGTTAQTHAAGATVECTISAFDADEWNAHTNASAAVHGFAGDIGTTLTTLSALTGAWTIDTAPNISNGTNWTLAAGSYQRYKQVSKTVIVELWAKCGANNTAGQFLWTLPVAPRDVTQVTLVLGSFCYFGAAYHIGVVTPANSGSLVNFRVNGGTAALGQGDGFFASNNDVLSAVLTYEAA